MSNEAKYPALTLEGVDHILGAVGSGYSIVKGKGKSPKKGRGALLVALNEAQNARQFRNWERGAVSDKHFHDRWAEIKYAARELADKLSVVCDDERNVNMDRKLRGALVVSAKIHAATPAKGKKDRLDEFRTEEQKSQRRKKDALLRDWGHPDTGIYQNLISHVKPAVSADGTVDWREDVAVNVAVAGAYWLAKWSDQKFGPADNTDPDYTGEKKLITEWLPEIFEEFFNRPFTATRSKPVPGTRFIRAALLEMGVERTWEAIAQMYLRHKKESGDIL
jgi:hypothetical protein